MNPAWSEPVSLPKACLPDAACLLLYVSAHAQPCLAGTCPSPQEGVPASLSLLPPTPQQLSGLPTDAVSCPSQVLMEVGILPVELWQLIFSYLHLPDLGRCSLVCRAWSELVLSLDRTRWRQLCLGCLQHRHPNWPNRPGVEPPSWREAFKQHYLASKTWSKTTQDLDSSNCLSLFRRRKGWRRLCVGVGGEFGSLRAALAAASPYDRLVLLPGVHEEQSEVLLKVPVEVVGQGKLGDVALLASIDQHCPTARLSNVVFMPARFTSLLYKVRLGGAGTVGMVRPPRRHDQGVPWSTGIWRAWLGVCGSH